MLGASGAGLVGVSHAIAPDRETALTTPAIEKVAALTLADCNGSLKMTTGRTLVGTFVALLVG
ncbi:MAG: hypothetical protein AMJ84_08480 [Acidithiobacillales bacterium SM23_46]|nr:MAG: hypothetical protein AMJ84_08480 [Acidithiobacillales bacterium SM23_46]